MKAEASVATCIWQGRRVAWFIVVGFSQLKHDILIGSTKLLQELLPSQPVQVRWGCGRQFFTDARGIVRYLQ